jgi:hypothetical protein
VIATTSLQAPVVIVAVLVTEAMITAIVAMAMVAHLKEAMAVEFQSATSLLLQQQKQQPFTSLTPVIALTFLQGPVGTVATMAVIVDRVFKLQAMRAETMEDAQTDQTTVESAEDGILPASVALVVLAEKDIPVANRFAATGSVSCHRTKFKMLTRTTNRGNVHNFINVQRNYIF